MVSDKDKNYLRHILDAIEKAEQFVYGLSYEQFIAHDMAYAATIREIEIIGEASYKLSDEFQEVHPDIPWHAIRGMRNHLIHGYFDVDSKLVWQTCQEKLPELKEYASKILV